MTVEAATDQVPDFKRRYWRYQYDLARLYLQPLLREWGVEFRGRKVVDLGCAEGGVLVAFLERGAEAVGLELSPSRARLAVLLGAERGLDVQVVVGDLLDAATIESLGGPFDLVLLRDVLEHVTDKLLALQHVRRLLRPGTGHALVTFPPFYSPFGGHQQMLRSWFRLIPYWHCLPEVFFRPLAVFIRKTDPQPHILREMALFRRDRLSLRHFERLAQRADLRVAGRRFYLSRPSHRLRYGWPVVGADAIGRVPVIREFLVSGAFFLLRAASSGQ